MTSQEEITVTVQLVYSCPMEAALTEQRDMIHSDLSRVLDYDSQSGVECSGFTIKYTASEAETYGNDEARSLAERQAARLKAALGAMAYPDDEDDAAALLQNALCDLRHFADQNGLAFAATDHTAHGIYLQEKAQ